MVEPITVGNLILDGEAEHDVSGNYLLKSQQSWEQYYAGSGKRIPTVGKYIITLKQLDKRNDPALQGILQDLREDWLCAGTIDYSSSNLPLEGGYLDVFVKDQAWRRALEEELFHYDAPETVDMLQRISGKRPYIWVPDAKGRKSYPNRAAWLGIDIDGFYLDCDGDPIDNGGRARGVCETNEANGKVPTEVVPEPTLLLEPADAKTNKYDNQLELQSIYKSAELEYARQLLDGISGGTVVDWKKR